ncbi:MAG: HlyC/CorC family transporter [Pseudobdellovibrionaceae bacterium]|nr:HlyC/CorC family transporter [Bdellovibrionales bacterium]USN46106.1 MAG: HlyC/CorC family transporter [Pseudobdellovibrionaceae bacterium]
MYLFLAVVVSFGCSLLESVILSVTPAYIAVKEREGRRSALVLAKLRRNIDQGLAAILTVNTIANVIGASGVGAQVLRVYGDEHVALASGVLAFVILFFSEIIPKTIGALYWKRLAPFCAYLIAALVKLTYPIVIMARYVKHLLGADNLPQTSREEMIETAEIGASEGVIRRKESMVIRNLLMLDKITVAEIMTPRSVTKAFEANQTVEAIVEKEKQIRFSRLPVFEKDMDHVVGLVHRYKILEAISHDLDTLPLKELMSPIHTVPETISVSAALDQFIKRNEHLFLVVDEYGIPAGLVTLEDAIETLLGVEILDEFDSIADMRAYAREQWQAKKEKMRGQA